MVTLSKNLGWIVWLSLTAQLRHLKSRYGPYRLLNALFAVMFINLTSCQQSGEDTTPIPKNYIAQQFLAPEIDSSLLYRLYVPDNLPEAYKAPLVLYLHSGRGRGNDNLAQVEIGAQLLSQSRVQVEQPCFVLAPQCPAGTQWVNTNNDTVPFKNYDQDQIPESMEMKLVVKLINRLVLDYPINADRIYVTGISMGGSGTWDIITRYPGLFAAAVPVNGVSDPGKSNLVAHLPIWAFHGRRDRVSEVENTRRTVKALSKNGEACNYTEYKTLGHAIGKVTYENTELWKWLFSQKRGSR